MQDGGPCSHRQTWTQAQAASPRRTLTIRPQDRYQALQAGCSRQASDTFKTQYHQRAGIEGTLSQGVRVCGLRQARSRGLAKVQLQQALTAAALTFSRLFAWLMGQARATTRKPAFVRLAKLPASMALFLRVRQQYPQGWRPSGLSLLIRLTDLGYNAMLRRDWHGCNPDQGREGRIRQHVQDEMEAETETRRLLFHLHVVCTYRLCLCCLIIAVYELLPPHRVGSVQRRI